MPARMGRAHAGQVEDDLDDDGAAHEVTDLQAERGDGRDQRVAQHIGGDDDELGRPPPRAVRT